MVKRNDECKEERKGRIGEKRSMRRKRRRDG